MKKVIATGAVMLAAAAAHARGALPASAATTTIGVGVQGVSGPGFPGTWMTASIARGSSQSWTLKVTNTGNVTETIQLVPSGALGIYGGGPANQPASNLHNTLSAASVSLAPGASATVTDTVTVPANAALGLVPGNAPGAVREPGRQHRVGLRRLRRQQRGPDGGRRGIPPVHHRHPVRTAVRTQQEPPNPVPRLASSERHGVFAIPQCSRPRSWQPGASAGRSSAARAPPAPPRVVTPPRPPL